MMIARTVYKSSILVQNPALLSHEHLVVGLSANKTALDVQNDRYADHIANFALYCAARTAQYLTVEHPNLKH